MPTVNGCLTENLYVAVAINIVVEQDCLVCDSFLVSLQNDGYRLKEGDKFWILVLGILGEGDCP